MRSRGPRTVTLPSAEEAAAILKRMRGETDSNSNYRSKSLKIHGPVCAKCGREFDAANIQTARRLIGNNQLRIAM